jgi:hypothetical protein
MPIFKPEYLAREMKRWARPDAANFVRPDWRRFVKPGSDVATVFEIYERKYRPDQARVPPGSREGGQWVDEGGDGGSSSPSTPGLDHNPATGSGASGQRPKVVVAGMPTIPRQRPPTSPERTAVAKAVAIAVVEAGAKVSGILEKIKESSWLYQAWPSIVSYTDAPKTLAELQQNASTARPGYDRHHIVEQSSAEEIGYPRSRIDAPENIVSIPRMKHWEINAWYQMRNPDYGDASPREYLSGKDWDTRQRVGLEALKKFGVLRP